MDDDDMMWEDDADADDGDDMGDDDDGGDDDDEEYKWENMYFQAKDMIEDNASKAIKEFEKIVEGESPAGDWTYKSLKRLVKLYFVANNSEKVFSCYKKLLGSKGRSENELFKGINKCLDVVSSGAADVDLITKMYEQCFATLSGKSESNVFKLKLKLAKALLDRKDFGRLDATLRDLTQSCYKDGKVDPKKGSNLIDIYSIEIQLALDNKDRKRTREIHDKALQVAKENPGILNSRLAIFHFCGGKIAMEQRDWDKAYSDLNEAFRFFEEGGSQLKIPCLKYILLANMLRLSKIDPFTSPEIATLRNHAEIAPMAQLAVAYTGNDIMTFEKILRVNKKEILGDPFIQFFLQDLLREVRTQVMLEVIKPYTAISLAFLSEELRISVPEVESLLVDLILDAKVDGHIDQVAQLLHLKRDRSGAKTFHALEKWAGTLANTQQLLLTRV